MNSWKWRRSTTVLALALAAWTLLLAFWTVNLAEGLGDGFGRLALFIAIMAWPVGAVLVIVVYLVATRSR